MVDTLYQIFRIENITVTNAPLLKTYYWQSLDIDGFNEKLMVSQECNVSHDFRLPTSQLNGKPLKFVFWIRNQSTEILELRLKRVQNCECVLKETQLGFNQFRRMFHCPHRRLIHILQERAVLQPNDLIAMSVLAYFFLFGEYQIIYEISCSDGRIVTINFLLDIIGFDPRKCIITKELIPIDLRKHERFVQAIWVQNVSMESKKFFFSTQACGLKVINQNLIVPGQSVWPLMVEYRPTDFDNTLDLKMKFNEIHTDFKINAKGILGNDSLETNVPLLDYECRDFLYPLYPNYLHFDAEINEERSLLIHVHNYNQNCVEFRWQDYVINELFDITFIPNVMRLKPHHSKTFIIKLHVHKRPMHFKNIPTVLEVHHIFDKKSSIARKLLTEVESIDNPKWAQSSYLDHILLNVNIKVNFEKASPQPNLIENSKPSETTIFEKLFWQYLASRNFMIDSEKISDELNYEEVLLLHKNPQKDVPDASLTVKNRILHMLSKLMAESLGRISRQWRFIPFDIGE